MSVPPADGTPLVTCVLTAFNYAGFVGRAVASAIDQRGLPDGAVEIVAIDDGSTDGTLEILEAMGPPVRVLRQQGLGPTVGTYRGIAAARGRYIALLDADDEWLPDKLARQVALLEARPEVGLVYGDMEVVDGDGRVLQPSNFAWTRERPAVGRALGTFLGRNLATTSTILLRADVARALPPAPDWAWCRDWWMAAHVAAAQEIDCIPDPVTRYRMHGSNLSALEAGQRDKTLRLWHRDLRVRRIFLRELDLRSVMLDEIAAAWERFVWFTGQVAGGRGVAPQEILPVDGADRAEAAEALARARRSLGTDPLAAGHAAARALGADPFDREAAALLGEARRRAAAGTSRPRLRSVAQADRVRELDGRRAAVAAAADARDRLVAAQRFDLLLSVLEDTGATASELAPATVAERDRALDSVDAALRAAAAGRHADAADQLATAVAAHPGDGHARLALRDALAALGAPPPARSSGEARAAAQLERLAELADARTFIGLVLAEELIARPALLAAWTEAFGEDDDATLVIYAPRGDEAVVVADLAPALAAAGVGDDDEHDLALVLGDATTEREDGLARSAGALLTRRGAPAAFAAVPVASSAAELRAHATRRFTHAGIGRPLTVGIKLCAERWDDAARSPDLNAAHAIVAELDRSGHRGVVQVAEEWHGADAQACDVALHLRGAWPYVPAPAQPSVLWLGDDASDVTPREAARFIAVLDGDDDVAASVDAFLAAVAPLVGAERAVAV